MPMPEDHIAAGVAGDGPPGPSHADREQVITVLKTAFVQGRLTKEELGTRAGQAYTAQTRAELAEVTADLPGGLLVPRPPRRPPRRPARTRPRLSMTAAVSAGAFAMLAALVGMMAAIIGRSAIALMSAAVIIALVGAATFGTVMVAAWRGRQRERPRVRSG